MHELSVVESMVAVVLKHAEMNKASKVTKINLVLGEASTVMEEPVRFYFELLEKDTIAEGAELTFRRPALTSKCKDCGNEFKVIDFDFICPKCSSPETEITAGREFQVESIEIE